MKKTLANLLKILVFFGVGFGILYLVYQNQDAAWQEQCALDGVPAEDCSLIGKILSDFRSANYFWLLMVLLVFVISNVSRTIRWHMLVRPLGYRPKSWNGFFTIMLGYFANLGFPRIGEVIRAGTFARYEGIAVEKVMGTVVVDRIADVLSMLLVMGLAFALQFGQVMQFVQSFDKDDGGGSSGLGFWLLVLAGAGLVGLGVLFIFRRRLEGLALYRRVVEVLRGFGQGIQTIRKLDRPWLFLFHSVNIWLMYYLMTFLGFLSFEPTADLGPMAALLIFVVGALGIVIPSPGGMGTYHLLVTTALVLFYAVPEADAFSFANILFFSVQIGCNILLGLVALVVLPLINRHYHPQPAVEGL
ncbi:MAG: flippase-like domain-containing protein [Saprospiraceae bacterium]|nr:flippase-like domain-containing protein [Saprospiraceae bacterium]MCB0623498.1 flippase-like domain-containing protein [Saprospiraceae bacterium]MCB0675795.1 flippase-like domain-containing protein [Saprospiraceae bacterium]MCB0679912.1 flippase-like domain-containing protein [Saprospiraceae bacterium]